MVQTGGKTGPENPVSPGLEPPAVSLRWRPYSAAGTRDPQQWQMTLLRGGATRSSGEAGQLLEGNVEEDLEPFKKVEETCSSLADLF